MARPPAPDLPSADDAAVAAGASAVRVTRFAGARPERLEDRVAREEPLEIQLGGASLAVVMRTPGGDEELALGFLLGERVISSLGDVASVRHCSAAREPGGEDNVIRVVLQPGVHVDPESLRRNFYANSSCGICGKASIENALTSTPRLEDASRFDPELLCALVGKLAEAQPVFARTGGLHAAGLFAPDGQLLAAREDVGRHNAVDKVVGWALRAGRLPLSGHVLVVSGRSSYEIVQKALVAGVAVVAAVSAPTSLAVELARSAGLTLVGFLRDRDLKVYSGPERIRRIRGRC